MKNRSILSLGSLALILAVVFALACNKKFDEPALNTDPGVTANTTIKQLKALYPTVSGDLKLITDNIIIKGIVVGNDKTGNIYKMMYIQDTTAGIEVDIDATGLYNTMPVGREVYVLCQGLYIANVSNMIKLGTRVVENGTPSLSGIKQTFVDTYIKRGTLNNAVVPKVVTVAQLDNTYQSMLIQLNNFEVSSGDLTKTYADTSANKASTNINLSNCSGNTIIVRTSGYANFAGVRVPQGNGTVNAIYTVFNTTKQLIIRDSSDLQFNGPRCGSGVPTGLTYMTLLQIRNLGATPGTSIPANTGIRGTIVSSTLNEATGNYRIQDASGYGIQLRFPGTNPNYVLNDSIAVDVSGLTVDVFNGDFQITNIGNSQKLGTGTITPRTTTVSAINTNLAASTTNNWASTVVKLSNVTIVQTSTNATGTNYNLTDATGTIVSFVRGTLGFTMPAFATSVTGYVSLFNGTPQLTIRNAADVVAGASATATVTTNPVTAITQTTATSGGNVTAGGTSSVTARGVVWGTATAPTVALSTKTTDGTGTGAFTSSITGLTASTTYYVRAYATNGSGTSYGNEVSFTTTSSSGGSSVTEDFETGAKTSYTAGTVTLNSGTWTFSDALLGTTAGSDVFNGLQSARIRGTVGSNNGYIQTEFGYNGLQSVEVKHAQTNFNEGTGTITPSFEVYISKNAGSTWTKVGATTTTVKGTFTTTVFTVGALASENVRVRILNTSSASISAPANQVRINVDDVKFNY
jgi:hypothetical protein